MTKYIPKVGRIVVPKVVNETVTTGVLNPLEPGTRIRATLGETVIVGKVGVMVFPHEIVPVDIKPKTTRSYRGFLENITLWVSDGWEFELLDA